MGIFSRWSRRALRSMKRFQRMHNNGGIEFATSIPFYPECDTAFLDDENVTDAPIRIFHGVADDYVSLPRCR